MEMKLAGPIAPAQFRAQRRTFRQFELQCRTKTRVGNCAQDRKAAAARWELAMAFRVHLFKQGKLKSVEFFDSEQFADAKACAIEAVKSGEADDAEVHEDFVGLVFRYTQLLS